SSDADLTRSSRTTGDGPGSGRGRGRGDRRTRGSRGRLGDARVQRPGRRGLAYRPGHLLDDRELAVLEHESPEVTRRGELDPDIRIQLAEATKLAVLLPDQLLAEGRELKIEVEVRQIEVRREALHDGAFERPQERKDVRLVLPADLVEVEDPGHLRLARVGE